MPIIEVEKDVNMVADVITSYVLETNRYKFTYEELKNYIRKTGRKISDEALQNALTTLTSLMFLKRIRYKEYRGMKVFNREYYKISEKFFLHILFCYLTRA